MWHKKIPKNERGRDFIFPDLHGQYMQFMMLLDYVNFDPAVDRVFNAGDIVDRGDGSFELTKLFDEQPNFHTVGGNHDYEVLYFIKEWLNASRTERNSLAKILARCPEYWIMELSDEQLEYVVRTNENKPSVITVEDSFNVCHATIVDNNCVRVEKQAELETIDFTNSRIWWDRTYAKGARQSTYPFNKEMLRTYCGHTVARHPYFDRGYVYFDCGGFVDDKGYGLCVADHNNNVIHKLVNVYARIVTYDIPKS